MKILFETYSGKKINKIFETVKDAKEYLLRNKAFIKEAQIMERPLGSGGWTPKKAIGQFVKGRKKLNDKIDIEDEFYDKLGDKNFETLVNEYCWNNHITIDDLNNHAMESLLIEYDEMIEKGWF